MITATIFEAKTNLSHLVKQARAGETVIITSGRSKTPVARIEAVEPAKKKRLGARYNPDMIFPESFWDPLPDDELALWNGEGD